MDEVCDDDLPSGWRALPLPPALLGRVSSVEKEIRREVASTQHPLFGVSYRVVAWNAEYHDDFLLKVDRPEMPFAKVHLTWQVETDPYWPHTVSYISLEAFKAAL